MADVKKLLNGYREFYDKYFKSNKALYKKLDKVGQSPKTLIIACSDSRVDPSIVANAKPGDIFVIRNVANLVPKFNNDQGVHGVSAALEFAVCFLEVRHIVVLGHSNCAGIHALMNPEKMEKTNFIGKWMEIASEARENVLRDTEEKDPKILDAKCEKEGIILSLRNLTTFPWLKERMEKGKLEIHGWHFSISDGSLKEFDPVLQKFEKIKIDDIINQ